MGRARACGPQRSEVHEASPAPPAGRWRVSHGPDRIPDSPIVPFKRTPGTVPKLTLRRREAMKALGIGEQLLHQKTKSGEIPSIKVGRCVLYPVAALEKWLADQAAKGGGQ